MVSSPGTGHFTSSLELANRLVTLHGIHVSFFTTTSTTTIHSHSSSAASTPDGLDFIELPPVDISELAPKNSSILARISTILRESLPSIRSYILNSSPRPTVLIGDEFSTDAFEIAESLHMKMYLLVTMNAMELALMANLPNLDPDVEIDYHQLTEPIQIPGCKPVPIEQLNDSFFQDGESESYKYFMQHARKFVKASGILVNSFHDLEAKTLDSLNRDDIQRRMHLPRVYPVGPLMNSSTRPSFDADENDSISYLTWLNKQPNDSVVYVSFGSGGTLSTEQITELAMGLEMSEQRFMWVVRPPQDNTASASYFNSDNGSNDPGHYLPDGFLDRTRDRGFMITDWAQQIEILGHKSVGGFLSHCGWNSTLESIVYGVPMIAVPLFAEQRLNAWMMAEDVKVAVRSEITPRLGVVSREEIERMVRLVMEKEEGKRLRNRTRELQQSALKGLEEGGSSYVSLFQVVQKWKLESGFAV